MIEWQIQIMINETLTLANFKKCQLFSSVSFSYRVRSSVLQHHGCKNILPSDLLPRPVILGEFEGRPSKLSTIELARKYIAPKEEAPASSENPKQKSCVELTEVNRKYRCIRPLLKNYFKCLVGRRPMSLDIGTSPRGET
jgi:hypothetical protein